MLEACQRGIITVELFSLSSREFLIYATDVKTIVHSCFESLLGQCAEKCDCE